MPIPETVPVTSARERPVRPTLVASAVVPAPTPIPGAIKENVNGADGATLVAHQSSLNGFSANSSNPNSPRSIIGLSDFI